MKKSFYRNIYLLISIFNLIILIEVFEGAGETFQRNWLVEMTTVDFSRGVEKEIQFLFPILFRAFDGVHEFLRVSRKH